MDIILLLGSDFSPRVIDHDDHFDEPNRTIIKLRGAFDMFTEARTPKVPPKSFEVEKASTLAKNRRRSDTSSRTP